MPPPRPTGWAVSEEIGAYRTAALEIVNPLRVMNPGAGKIRATRLTLPFWQQVVSDLKVVICLRNPLEVARS